MFRRVLSLCGSTKEGKTIFQTPFFACTLHDVLDFSLPLNPIASDWLFVSSVTLAQETFPIFGNSDKPHGFHLGVLSLITCNSQDICICQQDLVKVWTLLGIHTRWLTFFEVWRVCWRSLEFTSTTRSFDSITPWLWSSFWPSVSSLPRSSMLETPSLVCGMNQFLRMWSTLTVGSTRRTRSLLLGTRRSDLKSLLPELIPPSTQRPSSITDTISGFASSSSSRHASFTFLAGCGKVGREEGFRLSWWTWMSVFVPTKKSDPRGKSS